MGIKGGANTLFSVKATNNTKASGKETITSLDIGCVASEWNNSNKRIAFVDCNWVAHKFGRAYGPVVGVMKLLHVLKALGWEVHPVADPYETNDKKRVTSLRRKMVIKSNVEARINRLKINKLRQNLNASSDSEQRRNIQNQLKSLEKTLKKHENTVSFQIPSTFIEDIEAKISSCGGATHNNVGGFMRSLAIATSQADIYIAKQMKKREGIVVFTSDSDYFYLSGVVKSIIVKDFSFLSDPKSRRDATKMSLHRIQVLLPTKSMLQTVSDSIQSHRRVTGERSLELVQIFATYPILELTQKYSSPLLRGMIATALGCDSHPSGISKVGPSKVYKQLQMIIEKDSQLNEENIIPQVLKWMIESSKNTDHDEVYFTTLCYAFIGEPYNTNDNVSNGYEYLCSSLPTPLPAYIKSYADTTKNGDLFPNDESIKICQGVMGKKHMLLKGEETTKCHLCMLHLCQHCIFELDHNGSKVFACGHCWQNMKIQSAAIGTTEFEKLSKSEEEMRKELDEVGLEISFSKALDYVDIIGLYEDYVVSNYSKLRVHSSSVKGPKYSPSNLEENKKCIEIINFKEGGSFIGGTRITDSILPKVVHLFAQIVTFGKKILRFR